MKTYIGNRIMCLAQPEDKENQAGYNVLYPDGSETWLTKEVFDFEFRELDETEIQMIISTIVNDTLSEAELISMLEEGEDDIHPEDGIEIEMKDVEALDKANSIISTDPDAVPFFTITEGEEGAVECTGDDCAICTKVDTRDAE